MSPQTPPRLSAARAILAMVAASAVVSLLLGALVLRPIRRDQRDLRADIETAQGALRQAAQFPGGPLSDERIRRAAEDLAILTQRWTQFHDQLATFEGTNALTASISSNVGDRIDFKVALYNTRTQLMAAAAARPMALPEDIGLPATLEAEQRAEQRLWQLAAVTRLVERCLDLGIPAVTALRVSDPVARPASALAGTNYVTYPVEIALQASHSQAVAFVESIGRRGSLFALEHVALESVDSMSPDRVEFKAVCSAVVFEPAPRPAPREGEGRRGTEGSP